MAGKSIYEVDYSQEMAMPSDVLTENDYTQDVFLQTRPEIFDFDHRDRGEPDQGDPYFRDWDMDEEVKYQEKSLQRYNQNSKNWDKQRNVLINPYDRSDRTGSSERVVEAYLKGAATPKKKFKPYDPNKPAPLTGRSPTLAKLMHYTSAFSKKRVARTSVALIKAEPEKLSWTYRVKGKEKWSNPSGHIVQIILEKQPGMKDFREMKVKVTCGCEFWRYWGPDFNSGSGGRGLDPYRLGPTKTDKGVSQTPNIRDPGRHNFICKHVVAVGKIFQKYAAKHNLDTYKQVDGIFSELEKQEKADTPEKEIEGVKAIVEKLDKSEQRKIQPLITNYEKEDNEYRKDRIKKGILEELEDKIELKDKSWLNKTLSFIKKFFNFFKGSSKRDASVDRIIEMYLKEF